MTDSIFSLAVVKDGVWVLPSENITSLLENPQFETKGLEVELEGEQFQYGLKPVLIVDTKKRTSEAQLRAIKNYRKNHRERYNEYQAKLYAKYRENPEWKEKVNTKQKKAYTEKGAARRLANTNILLGGGGVTDWPTAIAALKPSAVKEFSAILIGKFGPQPALTKAGKIRKAVGRPKKAAV